MGTYLVTRTAYIMAAINELLYTGGWSSAAGRLRKDRTVADGGSCPIRGAFAASAAQRPKPTVRLLQFSV